MRPVHAWLANLHPECVERGRTFINGEEIEFGVPNRAELRRVVKEHFHKGQEALSDFRRWLIRKEGFQEHEAILATATVWNALCMTYDRAKEVSDPLRLIDLEDATYSYGSKLRICSALRHWARFTKDSQLYERLIIWMKRGDPDKAPKYVLEALEETPPYSKKEYRRLLKALEEYKRHPRYPWMYPCLRLTFACGLSPTEILLVQKKSLYAAVQQGYFIVPVLRRHVRLLPLSIVEEPVKMLLEFPWEWESVQDLVQPTGRHRIGVTKLLVLRARDVYKRARIEFGPRWNLRLRWTIAWLYYQKTKNLVGTGQIINMKNLATVSAFIEELKRRAAKQEKSEDDAQG